MVAIKIEKTVYFIFSYCTYILKIKLNINWQIDIFFKLIYIIDKIAFLRPYIRSIIFSFAKNIFIFWPKKLTL